MAVDHIDPVIPPNSSFEELGLDGTVERLWCDPRNLQPICEECHDVKTKAERKQRSQLKKRSK